MLTYTNFKFGCPNYMYPKSIRKFTNGSRIVTDTEYITNLRTINLKINRLIHTFCTPSTCYSAVETFIWSKENIFYKTENAFFFILQKSKVPISMLCHMKRKTICGVFHA